MLSKLNRPVRLAVVMTHPIQYYAPWFRHIAAHRPEIELMVHYCVIPSPAQQGVGFGQAFTWDSSLLDGYPNVVVTDDGSRSIWRVSYAAAAAPKGKGKAK